MNKWLTIVSLFLVFLGCEAQKAPQEYGGAMVRAMNTAQKIKYETGVQKMIQAYKIEHGKFPESLDDISEVPKLPKGWQWNYNKQIGKATIFKK